MRSMRRQLETAAPYDVARMPSITIASAILEIGVTGQMIPEGL
jgi:hypothetical protein